MSITTKRGDDGETDLLFGRRVAKTHPRVVACGDIDELNASLGLARVAAPRDPETGPLLARIQKELFALMGEIATDPADLERFAATGFAGVSPEMVATLTAEAKRCEESFAERFRDWAVPGDTGSACAAHLDLARAIARRAERSVAALLKDDRALNPEPLRYLNRLSDLLWLLARQEGALAARGDHA